MTGTLTLDVTTDPATATAWFRDLVDREPQDLSVVASVTATVLRDPTRYPGARWWAGREGGQVVAAFMHTPPHALHVAHASEEHAGALARLLLDAAEGAAPLPDAVGGLPGPAEAFAREWARLTGCTPRTAMEIGRYDLPVRPEVPFAVPGTYRRASAEDLPLVDTWHQAFVDAIDGPGRRGANSLDAHVAEGRVGLWVDDGGPVSTAYASPVSGGVTRVSGVWTPPEHRGHGYASAVVAALSLERLDAGEACMLFTDLANPTSNGIYQAIGYRRVGDGVSIDLSG